MPQALQFVCKDDEWQALQAVIATDDFPRGMVSWLRDDDPRVIKAEQVLELVEPRLRSFLANGLLIATGRPLDGASRVRVDPDRCDQLVILEDGTGFTIDGIIYSDVEISKVARGDAPRKQAQRKTLEEKLTSDFRPIIEQLKNTTQRTNWPSLRAHAQVLNPGATFSEDVLKRCAFNAGLTQDMIKSGRPPKGGG